LEAINQENKNTKALHGVHLGQTFRKKHPTPWKITELP